MALPSLGSGEYYDKVLQSFVDSQSFANMEFDVALRYEKKNKFYGFFGIVNVLLFRKLLEAFRLPGEAQKIDRIMQKFANSYCSANGHVFASSGKEKLTWAFQHLINASFF